MLYMYRIASHIIELYHWGLLGLVFFIFVLLFFTLINLPLLAASRILLASFAVLFERNYLRVQW